MATNTKPVEPNASPKHPLDPPPRTLEGVVHELADWNKPPTPQLYEDHPEWKRWALAGGLEQFAKAHNVRIDFLLHPMPRELRKAYVDTLKQDPDLGKALDAHDRNKAYMSDARADAIMAMIEGWDEEVSESEEEELCLPEVESRETKP